MVSKCYKFNSKGLEKAIIDRHSEKIGKWIDIGMWSIIGLLVLYGVISQGTLVKMVACSGTSKFVRWLMR